jgi:hypothetical protein
MALAPGIRDRNCIYSKGSQVSVSALAQTQEREQFLAQAQQPVIELADKVAPARDMAAVPDMAVQSLLDLDTAVPNTAVPDTVAVQNKVVPDMAAPDTAGPDAAL